MTKLIDFFKGRAYLKSKECSKKLDAISNKIDRLIGNDNAKKYFSQHGEDIIIKNIFYALKIDKPTYLDIGCNWPFENSNTALLYLNGSEGWAIDANPNFCDVWRGQRPQTQFINLGVGAAEDYLDFYLDDPYSAISTFSKELADKTFSENLGESIKVKVVTIDTILKMIGGIWPNFISVDIEGFDADVLESMPFTETNRPDVICIENDKGDTSGSKINFLLKEKGYLPAFQTQGNVIAVHNSHKSLIFWG